MYLTGVSARRIEDVSEILWGVGVSAGTVSNLNEKAFKAVDEWRCRSLTCEYPYVYIDGVYLKCSWGDSYENVAVMVAIDVNDDGCREVVGCAEGFTESKECWRDFLSRLKSRGLRGGRVFTGDKAADMVGSIAEVFPGAKTSAARCISTATCWPKPQIQVFPGSRRSTPWSRARRHRSRRVGGRRIRVNEAEGGRQGCARGIRRDVGVLRDAARALAAHPHE